jgi:hypothetical protein
LLIADGHHRYETTPRPEPWLPRHRPDRAGGLTIFPDHRIAENAGRPWDADRPPGDDLPGRSSYDGGYELGRQRA